MKGAATRKILSLLIVFTLIFQQTGFAQVLGQLDISKYLNQINAFSNPNKFRPLQLRYFSYDPLTNDFQILLDKGDLKELTDNQIKEQGQELLKYFLVGIALPDENFWVNLRPDSENQIIDQELTRTDLGKVLLEADLQLKKDVARFTSPETPTGKEYWNKLYAKAGQIFNSENITIPTLTRPWIVPGEVIIRETAQSAYVYKATLKVMLEQDHLKDSADYNFNDPRLKELNEYSAQLVRQIIIPKLTKEVNSSSKYASLRQVFNSLILARWFKSRFAGKSGAYPKLINTGNLNGLTSKSAWSKTTYFKEYQKSFSSGEYNIKEQVSTIMGPVIRTYFSGGITLQQPTPSGSFTGVNPAVIGALGKGMAEVAGNAVSSLQKGVVLSVKPARVSSPVQKVLYVDTNFNRGVWTMGVLGQANLSVTDDVSSGDFDVAVISSDSDSLTLDLVRSIREANPDAPIVVVAGSLVEPIDESALSQVDYLLKIDDSNVSYQIGHILKQELGERPVSYRYGYEWTKISGGPVASSPVDRNISEQVKALLQSNDPLIIKDKAYALAEAMYKPYQVRPTFEVNQASELLTKIRGLLGNTQAREARNQLARLVGRAMYNNHKIVLEVTNFLPIMTSEVETKDVAGILEVVDQLTFYLAHTVRDFEIQQLPAENLARLINLQQWLAQLQLTKEQEHIRSSLNAIIARYSPAVAVSLPAQTSSSLTAGEFLDSDSDEGETFLAAQASSPAASSPADDPGAQLNPTVSVLDRVLTEDWKVTDPQAGLEYPDPVTKILGHPDFAQENERVKKSMAAFYNQGVLGGTGQLVILPIDQELEHDYFRSHASNPPGADPFWQAEMALRLGMSGYATSYGKILLIAPKYAKVLPLIAKINNSVTSQAGAQKKDMQSAMTADIPLLARRGVKAIGFTIYGGSARFDEQYEELKQVAAEAKKHGMAVVVWSYPRGGDPAIPTDHETALDVTIAAVKLAVRAGANIIKIKAPSEVFRDPAKKAWLESQSWFREGGYDLNNQADRMRIVRRLTNGRVQIFSGGPAREGALREIEDLVWGGAGGDIIGRNSFKPKFYDANNPTSEKTGRGFVLRVLALNKAAARGLDKYADIEAFKRHAYEVILPELDKTTPTELKNFGPEFDFEGNSIAPEYPDEVTRMLAEDFAAENHNVLRNLERIYRHGALAGTGKLSIAPYVVGRLIAEISAYTVPVAEVDVALAGSGRTPIIAKITPAEYRGGKAVDYAHPSILEQIEALVRKGVAALSYELNIDKGPRYNAQMTELRAIINTAREHGLPVAVYAYPTGDKQSALDRTSAAAAIAVSTGAQIIIIRQPSAEVYDDKNVMPELTKYKLQYGTDEERMRLVEWYGLAGGRRRALVTVEVDRTKPSNLTALAETAYSSGGIYLALPGSAATSSPVTVPVLQKLAGKVLDSLDYKGVEFMQESLMRWNREKADISSDNSRLGRFSLRIEEDFIHLERAIKEGFGREITPVIIRYLDNLRKEVLDSKFETPRDSVIAIDAQLLRLGTSLDELDRYLFALADRPLPPLGAYKRPPAAASSPVQDSLRAIVEDPDPQVSDDLRLKALRNLISDRAFDALRAIAENPLVPDDLRNKARAELPQKPATASSPMVVSSSMDLQQVDSVKATEILDSRLNPTVKTLLKLKGNVVTTAAVPSGASTGEREALELRDGQYIKDIQAGKRPNLSAEQIDRIGKMLGKQGITKEELYTLLKSRYGGKGVLIAVDNVNNVIAPAIKDFDVTQQREIDEMLIALDGTEFKEKLGANAILSVSLAVARAAARQQGLQLFEYIAQLANETPRIPLIQMFNVINGGAHAGGNLDLQEFMIVPLGFKVGAKTYRERLEIFTNVYRALERILKDRDLGIGVGDEGGFAPILSSNEGALTLIIEAIEKAGYQPGADVAFALDPAASQFFKGGKYSLKVDRREFTPAEMVKYYGDLAKRFPIFSIEDGMAEGDKEGWRLITEAAKTWSNAATSALKQTGVQIVGDDLFVTNTRIFKEGIAEGLANSILIKVNQIGTLTETLDAIKMAKEAGYTAVISHRSGETDDDFISDLLVATATGQIKTGASRGERVAKHNRIMAIEAGILAATASSPVTHAQQLASNVIDSVDYQGVAGMRRLIDDWLKEKAAIIRDDERLQALSSGIKDNFAKLRGTIEQTYGKAIPVIVKRHLDNLQGYVPESNFAVMGYSTNVIDSKLHNINLELDALDRCLFELAGRPMPPLGAYERPPAASSPLIVKEAITTGQTPADLQVTLSELRQGYWTVNADSGRLSGAGFLPGRNITYVLTRQVPWKVRMYYNERRSETVARLFWGEQLRIEIAYEGDALDVPELKIREDLIAEIEKLLGEPGSAVRANQSSSPVKPGGIDFRAIPMITQPMGNLAGLSFNLPKLSNLKNINLETELNQIQGMVRAGIIPSGDRLKEYIAACYQKGELNQRLSGIVACLVDICKLEEEQVSESQAALKESLVIIDAI